MSTGTELVDGRSFRREDTKAVDLEILLRRHQADLRFGPQHAIDDANDNDDTAVGVVPGVEDQRHEWGIGIAARWMKPFDDRFENLTDASPFLGTRENRHG